MTDSGNMARWENLAEDTPIVLPHVALGPKCVFRFVFKEPLALGDPGASKSLLQMGELLFQYSAAGGTRFWCFTKSSVSQQLRWEKADLEGATELLVMVDLSQAYANREKLFADGTEKTAVSYNASHDGTEYMLWTGVLTINGDSYSPFKVQLLEIYNIAGYDLVLPSVYATNRRHKGLDWIESLAGRNNIFAWDFSRRQKGLVLNAGAKGQTDWIDSDGDGLADGWVASSVTPSIVTGNGFNGRAQRGYTATAGGGRALRYTVRVKKGHTYQLSCKYRTHPEGGIQLYIYVPPSQFLQDSILTNAGPAKKRTWQFTANLDSDVADLRFYVDSSGGATADGHWIEIDEVELLEVGETDRRDPLLDVYRNLSHPLTIVGSPDLLRVGGKLLAGSNYLKYPGTYTPEMSPGTKHVIMETAYLVDAYVGNPNLVRGGVISSGYLGMRLGSSMGDGKALHQLRNSNQNCYTINPNPAPLGRVVHDLTIFDRSQAYPRMYRDGVFQTESGTGDLTQLGDFAITTDFVFGDTDYGNHPVINSVRFIYIDESVDITTLRDDMAKALYLDWRRRYESIGRV